MKRSKVYEKDGTYTSKNVIKTPKTQNSIRIIPIPSFLLDLLKQKKHPKITEDSLVFTSQTGTMLISRNIMRSHYRACERSKIKPRIILDDEKEKTIYDGVGFHALRHTFATRLLEKNVNIKIISELLGHKDIQTTLNIYTHVTVDAKKEIGNIIGTIYDDITT